jgi:hypothetical protein
MRRLAFAVLLLSLELVGGVSTSNTNAGLGEKTSLLHGVAPPSQLGSGAANASTCRNGNSMWASCGGSSPAGITYATTAQNWTQTISGTLTGGTQANVTLTPCPTGVDTTSGAGYQVFISGGGKSEAVKVVSGSCVSGAPSGTITFTPYYSYPVGSTIGSASSGIQETINAACGVYRATNPGYNAQCNVTIPANGPYLGSGGVWSLNNYFIYGTIFFHANQSVLNGSGATLNCLGRGPCLQVGDLVNGNDYVDNAITGLSFRTPTNFSSNAAYAGSVITTTACGGTSCTIVTAAAHGFRPGDLVTILFTDNARYWGDAIVATVPTSTTFTYAKTATISSQTTPGIVALSYTAVLDNAEDTHLTNIQYDLGGDNGHFNNFFDMWDDENATIDHFNNNAIPLNGSANWAGSFVFSGGQYNIGHNLAPVITLRDSNITAVGSNGVTDYNSNGLYIENTVIQATGLWQVYSSNIAGNYQGAYLKNIYSETNLGENPFSSPKSPFGGTGVAGLIAGPSTNVANFQIAGSGTQGAFSTGGTGSTPYSYFIVANDTTAGTQTAPMQVLNWLSTRSDSIPVRWPRVANGADVITYDVIRMTTPVGLGAIYPYVGGCTGGSGGKCGYVAQGLSQATACSGGLVCMYTDAGSSSTSPYATSPTTHPLLGTYRGNLVFWPGSIVSVGSSVKVDVEEGPVVGVGMSGSPIQVANQCGGESGGGGAASPGGYTTCLATNTNQDVSNQPATILTDGPAIGGGMSLSKGRLNFATSPWAILQPHHIITLIDSQPGLTQGTVGYRPLASANDVWIGTDVPAGGVGLNAGQLAFGAPVSITDYIGASGVQANWLERLTSKQKTFAVPVRISDGNSLTLGDGSPLSRMKIYSIKSVSASHVPAQSCVDVVGEAKGLTKSDQIASITPPGRLGNLSLNAYPAAEGAIILHFCNPSGSEAIAPPGAYSFLSVR